jgi:hypothetical protein
MKATLKHLLGFVFLAPGAGGGASLQAQPTPTFVAEFAVGADLPDGDLSGLANAQTVAAPPGELTSLAVTLVLGSTAGDAFTGDLYATLRHEAGGYAVLLNRPGRRPGTPFGYSDPGPVHITLGDAAPADIHQYRLTLNLDETRPLAGALTGWWQPDGRAVDPLLVSVTDPRTAGMGAFLGTEPSGQWTLFLADVSGGGEFTLESWSLAFVQVPEPPPAALLLACVGIWVLGGARRPLRGWVRP